MNDSQRTKMYTRLYTDSTNTPKLKDKFTTTPKDDGKKELSQIDLSYSHQYACWFIKTFWGSSKAYRYNVRIENVDLWLEFMVLISEVEDDLFN